MLSKWGFSNFSIYGSLDFRRAKPSTTCYLANAIPEQRYKIGMPYAIIIATGDFRFFKSKNVQNHHSGAIRFLYCVNYNINGIFCFSKKSTGSTGDVFFFENAHPRRNLGPITNHIYQLIPIQLIITCYHYMSLRLDDLRT